MQLQSGTLLQGGKYKIERVLGQGGFGITYLAVQVGLNRQVAIKEFFMREYCNRDTDTSHVTVGSEGSRDVVEKFRSKFVKEAQNIACLKHPHIISIHDVFEENGTAYYVMEYLDRGSLAELVKQRGRLSEADALSYIRQIADALRYIHARKMNHLDVKPGNILIDETNGAVLIDFGLSKRYDDEGNQTSTTPVGISHGYAPLEQYKKGGVGTFSPSTDIYSLGATLYRLVTGETPPDANDVNDEGLPAFPSCVPPSVAHAIEQAMQPRRKDRPQSVDAFLALLDAEFKVEDEATMLDVEDKYENKEEHLTYPQGNSSSSLSFSFKKHFLPAVACVVVVLAVVLTISMQEKFLSVKEQYELAQNYYNGHGVTQDYVKAVEWYHKAAERGYADAQYKLGVCYYDGLGVTQDYAQSFEWCKKAAEHGLPDAQNHVGFCYKMGRGVEPDTVKAVEWYRKAAEQGQVNAQNNLGNSYYAGHGVTQDYAKAIEWYRKAAEQGFADAQYMLGLCYYHGLGVTQDYVQSFEWCKKAAEHGLPDAQYMLGLCYYNGLGVTQDYAQSFEWCKKAAEHGLPDAQNHVGFCYKMGRGVEPDTVKAVEWYRKAAEQGQVNAQNNLGNSYYDGHGVTQDYAKAVEWYRKAAEQGFADAQYMLGLCYYDGLGVTQDYNRAAEWLGIAQMQGHVNAGAWSYKAKARKAYTVNGVTFTMVRVAGGTFTMGSSASDSDAYNDEKPAHQVTLSGYSIGETEVTQALWQAVMGSNPSYFKGNIQCPVEMVSWNDCQAFIRKLNSLTGATFRLPTEAEWEYAARGGSQSHGYKYSGGNSLGAVAWYTDNSFGTTHAVKTKQPNELGLYDMSGNVGEWCADWYDDRYYSNSPSSNPRGPSSGSYHVFRGGGWSNSAKYCRSTHRDDNAPDYGYYYRGLRLVSQ